MSLQRDLLVGVNCYDYNDVRKLLFLMNLFQARELLALAVLVYRIMEQLAAQDRSPFCIFHIMNEIWQHSDLIHIFVVGKH